MPTAKAMSVAVGMPHPLAERVPWLTAVKIRAGGEEENHHQDVVDEFLHGHVPREDPVNPAAGAFQLEGELGVEKGVVSLFGEGKVRQQHRYDHAGKQHHAVGPGLLGKLLLGNPEAVDFLVPPIYRNECH